MNVFCCFSLRSMMPQSILQREGERTSKEEKREEHHASSLYVEACLLAHLLSFSDNHSCKHFLWAFWVSNLERKGSRELLPFMALCKCKADSNWLDSWRQNLGYLDQFRNNSWMFEFQLDIKVQSTVRFGNGFVKRIL